MARIAVVGSYGVGMTMRVPRMVEAGETLVAASFDVGPGGKGSNQAIGASRLGATADLLTCVGPDEFGRAARGRWEEERVGAGKVRTGTRPTMVGLILVEPGGENRIVIAPGALDELSPADVRRFRSEIARADLCAVVLEIPLETALAALRMAREVGTPTLLNPAPAVPLPADAWPSIDYLTPNRGEASRLVDGAAGDPEGAVAALRQRFGGTIVLTLGSEGAI
ncbi:MAG: ribokinase, partial [Candidatus Dormibacteraceae bacterium]